MSNVDLLIIGAGPVGCVVAERAATQCNWNVLLVDKRPHLAGNCYDRYHESGVLIQQYGPHIFRTNDEAVMHYLRQFSAWVEHDHRVECWVDGKFYPLPININTLEQFFDVRLDEQSVRDFLATLRVPIAQPKNSEEWVLSQVGPALYEKFYLNYTIKQWGRHPRELAPSVCGRISVKHNRDPFFTEHRYRVSPAKGFTELFRQMTHHPLIEVLLNTSFQEIRTQIRPRYATVYCGALDEYFDKCLGALQWRSMDFEFECFDQPYKQHCAQINYPNQYEYTRSFESKYITRQVHPKTVISYDFPRAVGDPYYPVPQMAYNTLFRKYQAMAEAETIRNQVFFAGRLAEYKYLNTDEAIRVGLDTFERLKGGLRFVSATG